MKIVAIDTSCDETSVAITDGVRVVSNVISSQVRFHKKFGGVVPFLAQRLHGERIGAVTDLALQRAGLSWSMLDALAVTYGPGLAPALQVGVQFAREKAQEHTLPLYAVNHMVGHVLSPLVQTGTRPRPQVAYPALGILVSGKHTELVYIPTLGDFQIIGHTLDDALGEAYDKVARLLGLGYPGGAVLAKLAEEGDAKRFELPIPMIRSGNLHLSYSGLKNAARLLVAEVEPKNRQDVADISAVFEYVAQASLLSKVETALKQYDCRSILLGGGVAVNMPLRRHVRAMAKKYGIDLHVPANKKLCTDNAAMIGVAGYLGVQHGQQPVDPTVLDRVPNLSIEAGFNLIQPLR
jgi:N6-L-threonylcarbamoyladenine synthase